MIKEHVGSTQTLRKTARLGDVRLKVGHRRYIVGEREEVTEWARDRLDTLEGDNSALARRESRLIRNQLEDGLPSIRPLRDYE